MTGLRRHTTRILILVLAMLTLGLLGAQSAASADTVGPVYERLGTAGPPAWAKGEVEVLGKGGEVAPRNPGFYMEELLAGFDNTTCNAPRNELAHFKIVQSGFPAQSDFAAANTGPCQQQFWKPSNVTLNGANGQTVRIKPTRHLGKTMGPGYILPNDILSFGYFYGGDANNSNNVDVSDYNMLAASFGKCQGNPGYDFQVDFNDDLCVDSVDFNVLKDGFGRTGSPPI